MRLFVVLGQIANNFSNLSSASFTFHSIASLISSQGFGNTDTKRTFAQWYFFIKLVFCFLSLYAGCWQQLYGNTNTSTNANPHKICTIISQACIWGPFPISSYCLLDFLAGLISGKRMQKNPHTNCKQFPKLLWRLENTNTFVNQLDNWKQTYPRLFSISPYCLFYFLSGLSLGNIGQKPDRNVKPCIRYKTSQYSICQTKPYVV